VFEKGLYLLGVLLTLWLISRLETFLLLIRFPPILARLLTSGNQGINHEKLYYQFKSIPYLGRYETKMLKSF